MPQNQNNPVIITQKKFKLNLQQKGSGCTTISLTFTPSGEPSFTIRSAHTLCSFICFASYVSTKYEKFTSTVIAKKNKKQPSLSSTDKTKLSAIVLLVWYMPLFPISTHNLQVLINQHYEKTLQLKQSSSSILLYMGI